MEELLREEQIHLLVENGGMCCKASKNVGGAEYLFSTAAILRDSLGTRQE